MEERWTAVDRHFEEALLDEDEALEAALTNSAAAGLPPINVSPSQGRFLFLLASAVAARRILEVGTLGGYSAICMARALPDGGKLITLELNEAHAEVARANVESAGLGDKVEIRVGAALDTLPLLAEEDAGPFDLAFIDADKAGNAEYFRWAVTLGRPGTVIIVDNVVRRGAVLDPAADAPEVLGIRRLNEAIAGEPAVVATAIQTVGSKGWDGFIMAVITPPGAAGS